MTRIVITSDRAKRPLRKRTTAAKPVQAKPATSKRDKLAQYLWPTIPRPSREPKP